MAQGAHEIRNPAAVILGYVPMLLGERLGSLNDSQRKVVGEIGKSAAKLAELAREMSFLARLMEEGHRFQRVPVELGALIKAEIPEVAPALEREVGIHLIDQAPAFTLNGDPGKLREAFNSLMYNHRRELVTSDELCVAIDRVAGAQPAAVRVTIGGVDRLDYPKGDR